MDFDHLNKTVFWGDFMSAVLDIISCTEGDSYDVEVNITDEVF